MRDRRDQQGRLINTELVRAAKDGSGFLQYHSSMPGNDSVLIPKLSYNRYLPKWDLAIGTSVNIADIDAELAKVREQIDERIRTMVSSTLALAAIMLVLLGVAGLALSNSILRPLQRMKDNLDDIAAGDGDLTHRLNIDSRDEIGALAASFNRFVDKIHGMVRQMVDVTGELTGVVGEMAAQAQRSDAAMAQQRHETEQVATAIHEMSAAAQEVAQSAQNAADAARQTDAEGQQAREVVELSIQRIHALVEDIHRSGLSMDNLRQDVDAIVGVLGVIRSIADQTNLLALNAAIEAARAGEAGRGFAVVADEVRALAHRTQQSTQEIEQMIGGIQQGAVQAVNAMQSSNSRAHSTLEVAQAAGQALDEITQAIASISERNLVIASASEEQAQVAREVDRNLVNIRDLSLQTSAGANQTSAASQELSRLAIDLNGLVARFRI
jgi:methyl-accepting chemotaxis protein